MEHLLHERLPRVFRVSWDPYSVLVDAKIGLVYVGDYSYSKVHAFTVTLKDRMNVKIASGYPIEDDLSRYCVKATGLVPNTHYSLKVPGRVTFSDDGDPARISLKASVVINYSGNWSISITEGIENPVPVRGSPFFIRVLPAAIDPLSCTTTYSSALTAGDLLALTLLSYDAFNNPTSHPDDSFYALLDLSPTPTPLTADFTLSLPMFKSDAHILGIFHSTPPSRSRTPSSPSP